jgi:hypothetical protein
MRLSIDMDLSEAAFAEARGKLGAARVILIHGPLLLAAATHLSELFPNSIVGRLELPEGFLATPAAWALIDFNGKLGVVWSAPNW